MSGRRGDFEVSITQHPRYVDVDKCIGCGTCLEKCPKKVEDKYNAGLAKTKAISVPYAQAVPLKYAIDPDACIYLTKGKCGACEKFCPTGAIDFNQTPTELKVKVGSVIMAPGAKPYDPTGFGDYHYGTLPGVVTSLEFERILSATGPYGGHLTNPAKPKAGQPKKIAWLQCVGSRDLNHTSNGYCSSVCCMYAVKQAIMAKDHAEEELDCAVFYMDMRTVSKDFDRYVDTAQRTGVRFIRCRVHSLERGAESEGIALAYLDETGHLVEEQFDLAVLASGLQVSPEAIELADRLGVELDPDKFVAQTALEPVSTSVPGVYVCGAFAGPKDIPQSVVEASAAACAATSQLAPVRHSQVHKAEPVPQTDLTGQQPRIGVFVCNCGSNIAGVVQVPEVVEYARTLPSVVHVEENLFTCSQDTQFRMAQVVREQNLNRVVVAACSPRTHEVLFQETLLNAGLNRYLFEMANIRNLDSWVHAANPDLATRKAKDMVAMAAAKAALLAPLDETELPIAQAALVIGGGLAGLTAALALAGHGFPVHLVERKEQLGGTARKLHQTHTGDDVADRLAALVNEVEAHELITVHTGTEIENVTGFIGNFKTSLRGDDHTEEISHGAAIIAAGAAESKPEEYLYGDHPAVFTALEFDGLMKTDDQRIGQAKTVAFIQCVGSRDEKRPYCSKVCCTHTMVSALEIKKRNPDTEVVVFYRDIRTYGQREHLYRQARQAGVIFIRYSPDNKPRTEADGDRVRLTVREPIIGQETTVTADLVCLAAAVESHRDHTLAQFFKVPLDADGWFLEAHQKLRPLDFAADGVFVCGMAHYPKPVDESIAQALGAASRALRVLTRETITLSGVVSWIDPELCSGCRGCVRACPYDAVSFNPGAGVAEVNQALCKGCGACAAACPSEAITLRGFNHHQIYAQIKTALAG